MTPQEKRKKSILEKYGSWEAYVRWRYHSKEAIEHARRAGRLGGAVRHRRGFDNIELASLAGKIGAEKRWHGKKS